LCSFAVLYNYAIGQKMNYVIYALILVPVNLIGTILTFPLAFIIGIMYSTQIGWCNNATVWQSGPRLFSFLSWFQTPDNSLDGDATFCRLNPPSYSSQVKWLWRNPAYSFALRYFIPNNNAAFIGDNLIKDNDNAREGWLLVRANGLFQFVLVWHIPGTSRCVYINLGWNIRALVDDNVDPKPNPYQATFVFSPRISGFR
jgi:hypothetical protein